MTSLRHGSYRANQVYNLLTSQKLLKDFKTNLKTLRQAANRLWPQLEPCSETSYGGKVASWLVRSHPDRAVRVRALWPETLYCVVFLGKTLYSHSATRHAGV